MAPAAQPLLFQAVSRPRQSLGSTGLRVLVGLLAAGLGLSSILFIVLGAWPVLGFAGAELCLVLGLFLMHRARARRCLEQVSLGEEGLRIRQVDGAGRVREALLDPTWARLHLADDGARLRITLREREWDIGLFLNADEKHDLARALGQALRRYREPRFDNPQLR